MYRLMLEQQPTSNTMSMCIAQTDLLLIIINYIRTMYVVPDVLDLIKNVDQLNSIDFSNMNEILSWFDPVMPLSIERSVGG